MVFALAVGGKGASILSIVSSAIVFVLCIIHAFRMYQDLFTSERKSVLHRRWLPDRDEPFYKIIAWCTLLSVVSSLISKILAIFWDMNDNSEICFELYSFGVILFLFSKLFIYWTFLFRLRNTFGKTSFVYNVRWLYFWTIVFSLYTMVNIIISIVGSMQREDGCQFTVNTLNLIAAGMVLVQDVLFSIGFVLAFIIPLKSILKYMDEQCLSFSFALDKHQREKVIYAAVKTTMLTCVTFISTVVVISLLFSMNLGFLWLDMLFNCVCLFLMTPYYDDAIYYQNICWCCIKCCTPKSGAYKSHVNQEDAHAGVDSVTLEVSADTMDQIYVCATDTNFIQMPTKAMDSISTTPVIVAGDGDT